MDGTLLNSSSRISSATAAAVRAVCQSGVMVVLATGKARPAALAAAREAGLEGQHLLVSRQGPGVFLQGLAVHGSKGQLLTSAQLQPEVVAQVFRHVSATYPDGSVSCVAFTGDDCVTLRMTQELQDLHSVYYEPLASVAPSLGQLQAGRPVRKLLLMTSPQVVQEQLAPHWNQQLQGTQAKTMQAVPNMLEIVPQSVNKWAGMKRLLQHLRVTPAELLAVGDGDNDLELITGAGVGVAMGNATPRVKAAADAHVASNDDDGVAQALEQFVLRAAWRK
ncbi:HAD-like domain-containing protein [Haematococcus lacustris]